MLPDNLVGQSIRTAMLLSTTARCHTSIGASHAHGKEFGGRRVLARALRQLFPTGRTVGSASDIGLLLLLCQQNGRAMLLFGLVAFHRMGRAQTEF